MTLALIQGVEHCVPARDRDVEMIHFAENLRREDETVNDALEKGRNFDLEMILHETRNQKEKQREQAKREGFVVAPEQLSDRAENHQRAQHGIKDEGFPAAPDPVLQILDVRNYAYYCTRIFGNFNEFC